MVDRLAALLDQFSVTAQVFHTGALCGINKLEGEPERGQLHLIREGTVEVRHQSTTTQVTEPSLLFYPRPLAHSFITDPRRGADFACANLSFDGGHSNPLANALPSFLCLPLAALPGAGAVLDLLFKEAFGQDCGRQAILDRLFEVVLIQVVRYLMEEGDTKIGMLAGLAHRQLRLALVAIHESPEHNWTLSELASRAGMSRSLFASTFKETVGETPGNYLQGWRISVAKQALRRGQPLKLIAGDVGYGSEAALSRAFKTSVGCTPREWLKRQPVETDAGARAH